ncbi:CIC11C00000002582 [Sungouiella intermedia]|uniref:CIC11C00000002582 n=1 Tax=Sungouiella intermedia TaxID=45354 RepID=A0A1L0C3B5_9ASCO|nr:CIC11C00000002582 [[Candida] intermedia]
MSQTKTILSYIQQNIRHNTNQNAPDSPRDKYPSFNAYVVESQKPARLPPRPRKPLGQRFPFTECTDFSLKQSRESVALGVKFAVNQSRTLERMHQWRYWIYDIMKAANHGNTEPEMDSVEFTSEKLRQMLKLPSILVKTTQTNREKLVEKFQEVMLVCMQKKFGHVNQLMDDVRVKEALNYATNVFLQEFKSSTTKGLCSEFNRSQTSGELADALESLAFDFMDKYEEIALEYFEDMIFEGTSSASLQESGATVDMPVYFDCFKNIWKLDPPNLFQFHVDVFIDEYDGVLSHLYSNPLATERTLNFYGEFAVKMNIHQFYWTYRDVLSARQLKKSTIVVNDLDKMDEFSLLRDTVEKLMLCDEEKPITKLKKSLRFAEPLMVE